MTRAMQTPDPKAVALAKSIDRTAQKEADSLLAGLSVLPPALRRIILDTIVRKLMLALGSMP